MRKKMADARKAERQSGRSRVHLPKFSRLAAPGNAAAGQRRAALRIKLA
jgi:hypothetical protein